MYEKFVFDDRLVSPKNGHSVKRLTKQNITRFGFDSIDALKSEFPDFPVTCDDVSKKQAQSISKSHKISRKVRSEKTQNMYDSNCARCKYCSKTLEYRKRKNIFCSKNCAAKFNNSIRTRESREQQKQSLNTFFENSKDIISLRFIERTRLLECKYYDDPDKCVSCGTILKFGYTRKTCNDECLTQFRIDNNSIRGKRSANKIVKRSKDETLLYELCKAYFSYVENNTIIADGWDADIVIPTMKLAIMWNGPWHYIQMPHKNHSLAQVQNRDKIKTNLFTKLGWDVIVFEDRYFTPYSAFEYIKIYLGLQ